MSQLGIGGIVINLTGDPVFGDVTLDNIVMEDSDGLEIGVIYKDVAGVDTPFIHNFQNALADGGNTFIGINAGNFTMGPVGVEPTAYGSIITAVGSLAGAAITKAYYCVLVGNWAGYALTTGHEDTFIGSDSGYNTTTAQGCTYVGNMAGFEYTTQSFNTIVGNRAGYGAVGASGEYNSFFGYYTGHDVTSCHHSVFVGAFAGENVTNGNYSTFIGALAGRNVTTGYGTIIGYSAGLAMTTADANTLIGLNCGQYITDGGYNVCIGQNAGFDPIADLAANRIVSDDHCIFIGYGATKNNAAAISNAIALGNGAWATKSNQMMLGGPTITECFINGLLHLVLANVPAYANNAAAAGGGLAVGDVYRTNADPSVLCIRSA